MVAEPELYLDMTKTGRVKNETSSRRAELGPLDEVQNVARNRRVGACWRENESDEER